MRNEKGQFVKGIIPTNKKDLTGQRFGKLIAVERKSYVWTEGCTKYLCLCDCGQEKIISGDKLSNGHTKSCGCLKHKIKDITGQRFGRAIAIKQDGFNKFGHSIWLFVCDCGKKFKASTSGESRTQSCGCLRKDRATEASKRNREDLTGNQYGLWTVLNRGDHYTLEDGRNVGYFWKCICGCGKIGTIMASSLKNGGSKSCGCVGRTLPGDCYQHSKTDNEKMRLYSKHLTDSHVKGALRATGYLNNEITNEMINFKRQQLTMYRTLKQFKQWREDNESDHEDVYGEQFQDEKDHESGLPVGSDHISTEGI